MVLLHEFDDNNVAVVATSLASRNNRNCPVSGKITPTEVTGST